MIVDAVSADTVATARAGALLLAAVVLAGCTAAPPRAPDEPVALVQARAEPAEDALLDVAIEVFDPEPAAAAEEDGAPAASPGIRQAEARFVPVHLKHTMQRSGLWGAVRVVPRGADDLDVFVRGRIIASDGEHLAVHVDAYDATGARWLSRDYEAEIGLAFYTDNRRGDRDAFQDLYNRIANDLATHRVRLRPDEVPTIRRVADLRFAADLSPDAYQSHLARTDDGTLAIRRLPAHGDPMYERVQRLRERDHLLMDTLDAYYERFYAEMWEPYASWRRTHAEEAAALRTLEREAMQRKALGIAAIAGAIAAGVFGNQSTCTTSGGTTECSGVNLSGLSTALAIGGAAALKSGFDKDAETTIHREAIEELAASFEADVRPLVVEVEGETVELEGSADAQYTRWRRVLQEIWATETGRPVPVAADRDASTY